MSAFCASLVGIELARFAYAPLLAAVVHAHWFLASAAAYLGAANWFAARFALSLLKAYICNRAPVIAWHHYVENAS